MGLIEGGILGSGDPKDTNGDGNDTIHIPEEIIVREFPQGYALVELENMQPKYALVNRNEFRDSVTTDAIFAFPAAGVGTAIAGGIGTPIGHTIGTWTGRIRHNRVLEAIKEYRE